MGETVQLKDNNNRDEVRKYLKTYAIIKEYMKAWRTTELRQLSCINF